MKKLLKKILMALGLFEWSKRTYFHQKNSAFLKKYGNINQWVLNQGGIQIVYSTADIHSKRWFFPRYDNGKIHEPVATKLFLEHIQDHSTVLDIGGHLGYFTCLASKLAPKGQVHVFEVDSKCISLIEENLRLNDIDNATVNNSAVSDHNGFEKIPLLENPNPGLAINSKAQKHIDVKAIPIDDYVSLNNLTPDFIKIDVEGAEWNVINGMKNVLKQENT